MADKEIRFKHESYGMIGISHLNCSTPQPLFGSSIKHDRFISLKIKTADLTRHLHKEWYYGNDSIIEVYLSAAQFTEFITNPNIGDGVPCTIAYHNGETKEKPPYLGQNEMFKEELKDDFRKAMEDADSLAAEAKELLTRNGILKVAERKKLLHEIEMLTQHIKANIPFLHTQFTRAMNKTVSAAKVEIESFYTSTILKLGKKALEKLNNPKVPEIGEE